PIAIRRDCTGPVKRGLDEDHPPMPNGVAVYTRTRRVLMRVSPAPARDLSWDDRLWIAVRNEGRLRIDGPLHPPNPGRDPRHPGGSLRRGRSAEGGRLRVAAKALPRRPLCGVPRARASEAPAAPGPDTADIRRPGSGVDLGQRPGPALRRGDATEGPTAPGGGRGPGGDRRVAAVAPRRLARPAAGPGAGRASPAGPRPGTRPAPPPAAPP